MDLNYLYSRHQISLINAKNAKCSISRAVHLRLARLYATEINDIRSVLGAGSGFLPL